MIELIIGVVLVVLIGIGYYLVEVTYNYEVLGVVIFVFGAFLLFVHIVGLSCMGYSYRTLETKVQITQQTINLARENNSEVELAAISQSIVSVNQEIALERLSNTTFIVGMWTDDRIDTLSYIK